MKLTQLAAKPQLIKLVIDDEDTVKEFGEPIEFYIWDRQPMEQFIKLAQVTHNNFQELVDAVKHMVLDENAEPIIKDDLQLPTHILTRVIGKVVDTLGK